MLNHISTWFIQEACIGVFADSILTPLYKEKPIRF
jgi:hypothetical protein